MIRENVNKLMESFYGILPYETAVHLANAQKEFLKAVESVIEEQIRWTDIHVERAHARGEEYEEVMEVSDDMILENEPLKAEEVKDLVEKNELSPERQAELKKEIKALKDEIGRLEFGRAVYDFNDNLSVFVQGSQTRSSVEQRLAPTSASAATARSTRRASPPRFATP